MEYHFTLLGAHRAKFMCVCLSAQLCEPAVFASIKCAMYVYVCVCVCVQLNECMSAEGGTVLIGEATCQAPEGTFSGCFDTVTLRLLSHGWR